MFLKKREKKRVTFVVGVKELSIVGREMKSVVEVGTFWVMVGGGPGGIRLRGKTAVKYGCYQS